jgi:hypothetical protein
VSFGVLCLGAPVRADVTPALLFTDNAVLQRGKPIPVWGTADVGEKVTVPSPVIPLPPLRTATAGGVSSFPRVRQATGPADLVIKGKNTRRLTNILVGEVCVASGQSNMEMTVKETYEARLDNPGSPGSDRSARSAWITDFGSRSLRVGRLEGRRTETTRRLHRRRLLFRPSLHESSLSRSQDH